MNTIAAMLETNIKIELLCMVNPLETLTLNMLNIAHNSLMNPKLNIKTLAIIQKMVIHNTMNQLILYFDIVLDMNMCLLSWNCHGACFSGYKVIAIGVNNMLQLYSNVIQWYIVLNQVCMMETQS